MAPPSRYLVSTLLVVLISACSGGGDRAPAASAETPRPAASTNANLSVLTVTGAMLEQVFDASVMNYTAVVGFLIDSISVDAVAVDDAATVKINGLVPGSAGIPIRLAQGNNEVVVDVTAEDGTTTRRYTVTVTRQTANAFAHDAYVKASNTDEGDFFGSVALSGNTLVVGAPFESSAATGVNGDQSDNSAASAGAVYVFTRDGAGVWSQQAYLKASNAGTNDKFGSSVALSDDTLAVGAPGEASAAVGVNGDETDDTASSAGAVYLFSRDTAGRWAYEAYIKASNTDADDLFGASIALYRDVLAVAAPYEASAATGINGDGTDNTAPRAGAVYVFARDTAGLWSQAAYLKASNTDAGDEFGASIALTGDMLAVGAPQEASAATGVSGDGTDNTASSAGAVYVFARDADGVWSQQAYLKASNAEAGDKFGVSAALSGETLAVGAMQEASAATGANGNEGDNTAGSAGAVYVFTRDAAGVWSQQAYLKASNAEAADLFGCSVALEGDSLAVGARNEASAATDINGEETDNTASAAGAVYVFRRDATGLWKQKAYVKASNADASDRFGMALALSGDTLAVTAPFEASNAIGVGGDETDNTTPAAGAVYLLGGVPSRNAALSTLHIEEVGLDQIFQPGQLNYTATVAFLVSSVHIAALAADSAAVARVDGAPDGSAGQDVALTEGQNEILIEVTAEDGVTTMDYTVTMTRQNVASFAQEAYLKSSNSDQNDLFGAAVALDGDTLVVGAHGEASAATGVNGDETNNSASTAGAVYVFIRDDSGIWSEQAYIKASNAQAGDGFGIAVALSGDTLAVGAIGEDSAATGADGDEVDNSVQDSGAVYVFLRDSLATWSQQAYIKASNPDTNDWFGKALALEGDTLAVGAAEEDGDGTGVNGPGGGNFAAASGAVYVFTPDDTGAWSQDAYIKASNTDAGDRFGTSVALSGNTLVVGASDEDSAATEINGDQSDNSASFAGAAYVFTRDDTGTWSQQAYIKASNTGANDRFGTAIAISENTLAVGAIGEASAATRVNGDQTDDSAVQAGSVYVYVRDGGNVWSQQAYIKASNAEAGDLFGYALALGRGTLAVSATLEDGGSTGINGDESNARSGSGAVYIFAPDGGGDWSQQAYIKASNTDASDGFGRSLALGSDLLAVGAMSEASDARGINGDQSNNRALHSGAVYVFR